MENDQIGEIIIKTNNEEDKIIPVFASEEVKKVNFLKVYSCLLTI